MPKRDPPDDDTDRRLDHYFRNGWAPTPFAHHPPHIRRAIRAAGMRPKMKCCFENCIRLVLQQRVVPLTYCEGFVATDHVPFPIEHAWLKDEHGTVVDVTLGEGRTVTILAHREFTREEVTSGVLKTQVYGPLDQKWFWRTSAEVWRMNGAPSDPKVLQSLLNPVTQADGGQTP